MLPEIVLLECSLVKLPVLSALRHANTLEMLQVPHRLTRNGKLSSRWVAAVLMK